MNKKYIYIVIYFDILLLELCKIDGITFFLAVENATKNSSNNRLYRFWDYNFF